MQKAYEFDFVHDTQQVFRQILMALSNPGKIYSIEKEKKGFDSRWAELIAISCTLLDHETTFYVEKTPELKEYIVSLTLSREETLENARFIYLTSQINYVNLYNIMQSAGKGSLSDPQCSATLIVFCDSLWGNREIRLRGPGVEGERTVFTTEYIENILRIRQAQKTEYPCGMEIILVSPKGEIMAFPRLVKAAGQDK